MAASRSETARLKTAALLLLASLPIAPYSARATEPAAAEPPSGIRVIEIDAATTATSSGSCGCGGAVVVPDWTYVVTHGMGRLSDDDPVFRLARAIKRQLPGSRVLVIDWSHYSDVNLLGLPLPLPWLVAGRIQSVGQLSAALLAEMSLDLKRTTLLGESFGNYVNAELARALGGVERILAFNPASELGGFPPPDLRSVSQQSWAFYSGSLLDTTRRIAEREVLLEAPQNISEQSRHRLGVRWLTERLELGDSWLIADREAPASSATLFKALVTAGGEVVSVSIPRADPRAARCSECSMDRGFQDAGCGQPRSHSQVHEGETCIQTPAPEDQCDSQACAGR